MGAQAVRVEFHDRGKPVLPLQALPHGPVIGHEASSDDRPIMTLALLEQFVQIDRLVRPMKITDADVKDPGG